MAEMRTSVSVGVMRGRCHWKSNMATVVSLRDPATDSNEWRRWGSISNIRNWQPSYASFHLTENSCGIFGRE